MSEAEHTHTVAEHTEHTETDGKSTRKDTRRTTSDGGATTTTTTVEHGEAAGGEPKQVQPDGR